MIEPLSNRVVVKPAEEEDTTKGGIFLPQTSKEKPQQGLVLAVGPGRTYENGVTIPVGIKVGQTVIYSKFGGTEITTSDDKKVLILTEDDILAVVKESA